MFEFFKLDFKRALLVGLILALPLISLNIERRDSSSISWYDLPIIYVVNPVQSFFSNFAQSVTETTKHYLVLLDIKKDNRVLSEKLAQVKFELTQLEELRLENLRLRRQLEFQKASQSSLLSAQVVAVDLLWGEYRSLQINKGKKHGLKKGMAVITYEGVVGYLLNTSSSFSTVLVLTDRNAVIDAIVQRTRARGIVEGLGRDLSHIKYLQRTDDVKVSDVVVTSGFDGVFPKGLPVGTVTKVVKKPHGVTQSVEMNPTVDTSRLEEVFIVLKPSQGIPFIQAEGAAT